MRTLRRTDTPDELDTINWTEWFENDPRPTFIIDLAATRPGDESTTTDGNPIYCNQALRLDHELFTVVTDLVQRFEDLPSQESDTAKYRAWIASSVSPNDSKDILQPTCVYQDLLWVRYTIRHRWRAVSVHSLNPERSSQQLSQQPHRSNSTESTHINTGGSSTHPVRLDDQNTSSRSEGEKLVHKTMNNYDEPQSPDVEVDRPWTWNSPQGNANINPMLVLSTPVTGVPDCTASCPTGSLSSHILFFRSLDWASTPLGGMNKWSREFRQVVNLVMGNPHPAALFWGNELTMLYNEAYAIEVAGNKHPALLGTGFAGPFREIWEGVRPLFVECARTGTSIRKDNNVLFMERRGFIEETYFSWSFTPIYGSGSKILGFYNAPFETTAYCVGQRRTKTLQRLDQSISSAKTVTDFWKCVLSALEDNSFDIPFALLYSVGSPKDYEGVKEEHADSRSIKTFPSCHLEGSIGVPAGHPAAPTKLDLRKSNHGWTISFREAMRTREPTKLQISDDTLPKDLLAGLDWRGFEEPCEEAVILPLRPTNSDAVVSILLLGCNSRRRYDTEYQAFTNLMSRQLATSLASILLFEEQTRRSKKAIEAAALQQEQLNEQLAVQTDRLRRMTTFSPLGMFYIDPDGLILEANDRYWEMTSQKRDELFEMSWLNQLVDESKAIMVEGWKKLTIDLQPFSAELRLDKQCFDVANPMTEPIDYWVLANAYPELTADGNLRSIMGSITDISHLKWAQGLQDRRLREAEETRRQQNEFIDITSHEMRNPMSAVLQCADDIAATLSAYQNEGGGSVTSIINECIELADTITVCVQHQKSIVDDILTVSKLDSNLVALTPVAVQPIHAFRQIVKVFEPEFVNKKIDFDFVLHPSFKRFDVDWVLMDSSRVAQIVINFMTNAIKFTSSRQIRKIKMYMGASLKPPIPTTPDFQYIPRKNIKQASLIGDPADRDQIVYIRIKVEDTGCGLTENEKQLLFQHFQQASPRTHAQYGGSGLGLFISRQLTELHGGQIGVASTAGVGSTFGFYIAATKTTRAPSFATPVTSPAEQKSWLLEYRADMTSPDLPVLSSTKGVPEGTKLSSTASPSSSSSLPKQLGLTNSLSLLVVEDNLINQRVMTKQFYKAGCQVQVAGNGQLALDFLQTTQFWSSTGVELTAVLMDLEMPVMDGLTCVREIRKLQKQRVIKRHVPVIAITANVRKEQINTAIASGMDDVISKPFRIADALAKIKALLQKLNSQEGAN